MTSEQQPKNQGASQDSFFKEEGERRKEQIRAGGIRLMRQYATGQVKLDEIRDFYQSHATDLVSEKAYRIYKEDAAKNNRETISWPDYVKEMIPRVFVDDFVSQVGLSGGNGKPVYKPDLFNLQP